MIKGRTDNAVILGLSRMNVERLLAGMPIRFSGEEVDIPGILFVIFAGETEKEMEGELRKFGLIGPNTKISDRLTGKGNH